MDGVSTNPQGQFEAAPGAPAATFTAVTDANQQLIDAENANTRVAAQQGLLSQTRVSKMFRGAIDELDIPGFFDEENKKKYYTNASPTIRYFKQEARTKEQNAARAIVDKKYMKDGNFDAQTQEYFEMMTQLFEQLANIQEKLLQPPAPTEGEAAPAKPEEREMPQALQQLLMGTLNIIEIPQKEDFNKAKVKVDTLPLTKEVIARAHALSWTAYMLKRRESQEVSLRPGYRNSRGQGMMYYDPDTSKQVHYKYVGSTLTKKEVNIVDLDSLMGDQFFVDILGNFKKTPYRVGGYMNLEIPKELVATLNMEP